MQHTPYYYVKLPLIGQSRINYLQATRETNHLGALGPILLGFFLVCMLPKILQKSISSQLVGDLPFHS